MLDLVQMLATDPCNGLLPVVQFIRKGVFPIIQIGIPILLIIMGSIDLGKAVLSSDDKEIKGATGKLIKRVIYAVVIFFIPFIVNLVMNIVAVSDEGETKNQTTNWFKCWESK